MRKDRKEGSGKRVQGVSIIIPVYNEETILRENVGKVITLMDSLGYNYEIIIASNGSTDSTVSIGKELSKDERVVFFHIPNKGVGLAFKKALIMSRYPLILSLDMDLSIDMSFVSEAISLSDKYSIVIGSKKTGSQDRSFFRTIPSSVFIFLVRLLLGLSYKDYSMAAKAYRKDVVMRYIDRFDSGTSYVIDTIYLAKKDGEPMIEIPVRCEDRRKSKFNIAYEAGYRFRRLIKLWWHG